MREEKEKEAEKTNNLLIHKITTHFILIIYFEIKTKQIKELRISHLERSNIKLMFFYEIHRSIERTNKSNFNRRIK